MTRRKKRRQPTPWVAMAISMSMISAPNAAMAYSSHDTMTETPSITNAVNIDAVLGDSLSDVIKAKESVEAAIKEKENQYKNLLSKMIALLDLDALSALTSRVRPAEVNGHGMLTLGSVVIALLERQELTPNDAKALDDMKKLNEELIAEYGKLDELDSKIDILTSKQRNESADTEASRTTEPIVDAKSQTETQSDTQLPNLEKSQPSTQEARPVGDAEIVMSESKQEPETLSEPMPSTTSDDGTEYPTQPIADIEAGENLVASQEDEVPDLVIEGDTEVVPDDYSSGDDAYETSEPYGNATSDTYDETYDMQAENDYATICTEPDYAEVEPMADEAMTDEDDTEYSQELSGDANDIYDSDFYDQEAYDQEMPETQHQASYEAEYEYQEDTAYDESDDTNLPALSETRDSLVSAATSQLGVPYVYGASSPGEAFDCSGFTSWSYSQIGIDLPHSAAEQAALATEISYDEMQAGDLVFYIGNVEASQSGNHVAMYVGDNQVIHANGTEVAVSDLNTSYTSLGSFL